jgi:hypothetical protein
MAEQGPNRPCRQDHDITDEIATDLADCSDLERTCYYLLIGRVARLSRKFERQYGRQVVRRALERIILGEMKWRLAETVAEERRKAIYEEPSDS